MGCAFRNSAICRAVSPADLPGYAPLATELMMPRGMLLAEAGAPADSMYIMREGIAFSHRTSHDGRRQIVQLFFPEETMGVTESKRNTFSLQAMTDVVVCRFDRKELEAYMYQHPAVETVLLMQVRRKLFGLQEHLISLTRSNSLQAVASFIYYLQLRQRYSVKREAGPVHVPFSRADICDFLSLTPETVSRCFSKLRAANLIRINQQDEIEVLDQNRLFVAANQKFQHFDSDLKEIWG